MHDPHLKASACISSRDRVQSAGEPSQPKLRLAGNVCTLGSDQRGCNNDHVRYATLMPDACQFNFVRPSAHQDTPSPLQHSLRLSQLWKATCRNIRTLYHPTPMASKAKATATRASARTKATTSVPTTTRTTRAAAKAAPKAQAPTALPAPKRTATRKPLLNRDNSTEPPDRPAGKKPAGATKAPISRAPTATSLKDDTDREPIKVIQCLLRTIARSPLFLGLPPYPPTAWRWGAHIRALSRPNL